MNAFYSARSEIIFRGKLEWTVDSEEKRDQLNFDRDKIISISFFIKFG